MEKLILKQNEMVTAYVIPYQENSSYPQGWGCGYIQLSKNHPFAKKIDIDKLQDQYGNMYPQLWGFNGADFHEETTYFSDKGDCYVLGFDTSHSYNNATHDYEYVAHKAMDMFKIVSDFDDIALGEYATEKIREITYDIHQIWERK